MSAAAQIALAIKGQDQTGAAFSSVAKQASASLGKLKHLAIAAGAGLGLGKLVSSAKEGIQELGLLSDQAQRMGTSSEYVQKLTGALGQVGVVGVNVDNLASAFGRMTKETGKTGAEGFKATMEGIAGLGTEQERVNELVRVFGREMGAKFAPLVRQGPEAFSQGLDGVMAAMPAVSDAAVNAGDMVADAMSVASAQAKTAWLQTLGNIIVKFQETFGMSLGEAIAVAVEYVKFGAKVAWEYFRVFGENIGRLAAFFVEDWRGALKWVWDGFTGWLSALWELFKSVFVGIKNIAVEFGKQFWNWISGDEADWGAIWDTAVAGAKDAADKAKKLLSASVPRGNDKIQFAQVDMEGLRASRDAAIEIQREGVKAAGLLATGRAEAETAATEGAAKIAEAAKEAKAASAASYDYVKIAAAARAGGTMPGAASPAAQVAAGKAADQSRTMADVAGLLRQMLALHQQTLPAFAQLEAV